jgi:hypothetical protein
MPFVKTVKNKAYYKRFQVIAFFVSTRPYYFLLSLGLLPRLPTFSSMDRSPRTLTGKIKRCEEKVYFDLNFNCGTSFRIRILIGI